MHTEEQRVAFLNSQIVSAQAKILGMQAENMQRQVRGESMAYVEADFVAVPIEFGLHHNAAITLLQGDY